MKNPNKLIVALYFLSRLTFRIIIVFAVLQIFFEVFTTDGKIGTFSVGHHHSKGYPVKARVDLIIPDTLIVFKSINSKNYGQAAKSDILEFNKYFNKINKDNHINKTYQINNFTIYDNKSNNVNKKIDNLEIECVGSEINVIINPKNIYFKAVLILKSYLSYALFLFIYYQFMQLFQQLKENFVFDQILSQRILNIGYSLLICQVIGIIISIITTQHLSQIDYYHYTPLIENSKFKFMNLQPIIEYNYDTLFLGLCLIFLSRLLSYGLYVQKENDLTI